MERIFLKHVDAQDLQGSPPTFRDLMNLLETGYQEVDADRDPNLGFDGVLAGAVEGFDTQVLLDPFEEQLDVPTTLVDGGDTKSGEIKMVGQEDQRLARFRITEADAKKPLWIRSLAARTLEADDLVTPRATGSIHFSRLHDIKAEVGFGTPNKVGFGLLGPMQSLEIDVSTIHDIDTARLRNDLIEDVHVMHTSLGNADTKSQFVY